MILGLEVAVLPTGCYFARFSGARPSCQDRFVVKVEL
jgi:hypothetical protein